MFADLASPGTIENLATNPHVEINVVDPILRKGYRFKGTAAVYTIGQMFDHGLEILRGRGSTATRYQVHSIVVIDATSAAPVVSPAYDDGTSEETIIQRWRQHYERLHHPQPGWPLEDPPRRPRMSARGPRATRTGGPRRRHHPHMPIRRIATPVRANAASSSAAASEASNPAIAG